MLSLYTFGNSKAAQTLCKILEERSKKVQYRICRQINKFTEILVSISQVSNQEHREKLALMVLNYYLSFFKDTPAIAYDFELLSFYKNILKARYRQII
jgi:hypothetical protein